MNDLLACKGAVFNTGKGVCPYKPENIEAMILTMKDKTITVSTFDANFEEMIHADRPNRIYPIGGISEYAPSGGEAQSSAVGYGPSKFTGYSTYMEAWTLDQRYLSIVKNLLRINVPMRVFLIDKNNVVYGEDAGNGKIRGFLLSDIYPSGQTYNSSGAQASIIVNLSYKDVEAIWSNTVRLQSSIDLVSLADGLTWVSLVSTGTNKYKLKDYDEGTDITVFYGALLASTTAWNNVTAATYDATTEELTLTPTAGMTPSLKRPSELFALSTPVKGIEQWTS